MVRVSGQFWLFQTVVVREQFSRCPIINPPFVSTSFHDHWPDTIHMLKLAFGDIDCGAAASWLSKAAIKGPAFSVTRHYVPGITGVCTYYKNAW